MNMLNIAGHQKKNFTTTELLVVMAIIATLMGMGLGVYSYASTRMAETRTRGTLKKLEVALERYKEKYGYYIQSATYNYFLLDEVDNDANPTTYPQKLVKNNFCQFLDDYEQLKKNDCELNTTTNRYQVIDGFGGKILYRCPGYFNKDKYDIVSAGSNAAIGNLASTYDFSPPTDYIEAATGGPKAKAQSDLGKGDDIANFTR